MEQSKFLKKQTKKEQKTLIQYMDMQATCNSKNFLHKQATVKYANFTSDSLYQLGHHAP